MIRKTSAIVSIVFLTTTAAPFSAEPIRAALGTVANGYSLKITVNDVDMPMMRGGESQIVQLFAVNHPMKSKADARAAHLFCLRPGKNSIRIEYARTGGADPLRLYLKPAAYSVDLFSFTIPDAKGSVTHTFEIQETMPPGYQTVTRPQ